METVAPAVNDNSPEAISLRSVNEDDNLPTTESLPKENQKMKEKSEGGWVYSKQFYSKKPLEEWATAVKYNEMFTEENGDVVPYNPFYRQDFLAKIPEVTKNKPQLTEDTDRDTCMILPVKEEKQDDGSINRKAVFPEEDKLFLKEAKLPIEEGLHLKSMFPYAEQALGFMKELVVPTLVPETIKDFFVFNIADSKNANAAKGCASKFHFSEMFKKSVTSESLVHTYYTEKKSDFQWDPQATEMELSPEKRTDLEEKMRDSNISYFERKPNMTKEEDNDEGGISSKKQKKRKTKNVWTYTKPKKRSRNSNKKIQELQNNLSNYEYSII
ncbi:unnamed protein product [Caenorhabditis brenneri]